tara:strand:- start:392 stop:547 length:156 start_codon:yes stop_codon:yes gene_type:complete
VIGGFGWEYPAGAAGDSNAPWNETVCDSCGHTYPPEQLSEEGVCADCKEEE